MRFTRLHVPTLKEVPADAEVVSHKLLLRAGMIRQVARGIYDFLPLGLRTVRKVERIIREELDNAGCQEVLLPIVSPAELWQESGRWDLYGKELLRVKDRHDRDFCIGPTHEELMTDLVRRDVRSYRELPLNLYQIQTKFRDEVRPRFGLMRGREFIMKDGYSFHADYEDCRREYEHMRATYSRIFRRCGLEFRAVEADTGAIGGTMSHEFQVLATSGEDLIVSCTACDYAANIEKAEALDMAPSRFEAGEELAEVATPNMRSIEEVSGFLGMGPERFIKTLVFIADGKPVAALVRGDDQISEAKLKGALEADALSLADETEIAQATGAPQGFAGPVGLEIPVVADLRLAACTGMVTGANKKDTHLKAVDQARDFPGVHFADLRTVRPGDVCARCSEGSLEEHRGIEVGQVFYLGKKYSAPLKASFLDPAGNEVIMEMGTYGIGVTRTMAAAIEQNHDERGIIWPTSIAPYEALIVPVKNDAETMAVADKLYDGLWAAGVETLIDDRDERAGVKFNDADLLGIPWRITIGPRGLKAGTVELKARRDSEACELPIDGATAEVARLVGAERADVAGD